MEQQILDAPTEVEKKLNYAGFWIRFGAYLIDAVLIWIVNFIVSYIFFGGYSFLEPNPAMSVFQIVLGIGYFTAMESSARQATFGKMAVGVKVGDPATSPNLFPLSFFVLAL
jgi:uncharacterized RDD family membrane protein YckC